METEKRLFLNSEDIWSFWLDNCAELEQNEPHDLNAAPLRWDYDSGTYRERFRLFESRAEEAKGREGTAKSGWKIRIFSRPGSEDSATDSKPYKKTSRD